LYFFYIHLHGALAKKMEKIKDVHFGGMLAGI
jgi:hypothetical protein